jgi:hypothetical protein
VNVVEYYVLMYENGKTRPVETVPGMRGGRLQENDGGVNSTMIYWSQDGRMLFGFWQRQP